MKGQNIDATSGGARAYARAHLLTSAAVKSRAADECLDSILEAADIVANCFRKSRKVMICGNGGSAADAQHIASEFVNRMRPDLERRGLPAIALTTDTSFLTAFANDCGYEGVFERQIATLGCEEDVLIAISTSGNSPNIIRATSAGREKKMKVIGLSGEGGRLRELVDVAVVVPSKDTQHVQEVLLAIEHTICMLVEQALFGQDG
jgi:D-sedoheptulose 7-phosphate isomerase